MVRLGAGKPHPRKRYDKSIVVVFGEKLKAARLKTGLTQAQLAQGAGLLQQYISLIELGKQNVTLETAEALADVVDRDVRHLLPIRRPRTR
jgi:transcriptional regulator with XRE-family HTH domain